MICTSCELLVADEALTLTGVYFNRHQILYLWRGGLGDLGIFIKANLEFSHHGLLPGLIIVNIIHLSCERHCESNCLVQEHNAMPQLRETRNAPITSYERHREIKKKHLHTMKATQCNAPTSLGPRQHTNHLAK